MLLRFEHIIKYKKIYALECPLSKFCIIYPKICDYIFKIDFTEQMVDCRCPNSISFIREEN